MEKISVVIPTYNGAEKIKSTIDTVEKYLKKRGCVYEIIIVNDGSTDNTSKILLWLNNTPLRVLSYPKNRGKGYAVRMGLIEASHPLCIVLDDDLSVNIDELDSFNMNKIEQNTIIKGSRRQIIKQPLYRLFVGKVWKILVWLKTGIFEDTQCPFWILHCPKECYKSLTIDGFAWDVELLHKARQQFYPIRFVSVKYFNDPNSRVTFKKTMRMLMELIQIR